MKKFCNYIRFMVLIWLLPHTHIYGQVPKLKFEIKIKADRLLTDRLGNLYLIDGPRLLKYNTDGRLLYIYDDNSYGNIEQVDAFDPFKILFFFPAFMQTVFLNEQLAPIKDFDLASMSSLGSVAVMCVTNESNFWLFDTNLRRLRRIDRTGKIIAEGTILQSSENFNLNGIMRVEDTETYLFMVDNAFHLDVFDKFGNLLQNFAMGTNTRDFQGSGSKVYYLTTDNLIKGFNFADRSEIIISLPPDFKATRFRIEKDKLFLLNDTAVRQYVISDN